MIKIFFSRILNWINGFFSPLLFVLGSAKRRLGTVISIVLSVIFSAWSLLDGRQNSKVDIRAGVEISKPQFFEKTADGEVQVNLREFLLELDELVTLSELSKRNGSLSKVPLDVIKMLPDQLKTFRRRVECLRIKFTCSTTYDNKSVVSTSIRERAFTQVVDLKFSNDAAFQEFDAIQGRALKSGSVFRSGIAPELSTHDFVIPSGQRVVDVEEMETQHVSLMLHAEYRAFLNSFKNSNRSFEGGGGVIGEIIPLPESDQWILDGGWWKNGKLSLHILTVGVFGEQFETSTDYPCLFDGFSHPKISQMSFGTKSIEQQSENIFNINVYILAAVMVSSLVICAFKSRLHNGSFIRMLLRWFVVVVSAQVLVMLGAKFDSLLAWSVPPVSTVVKIPFLNHISQSTYFLLPLVVDYFFGWLLFVGAIIAATIALCSRKKDFRVIGSFLAMFIFFCLSDFIAEYTFNASSTAFLIRCLLNFIGALIMTCILEAMTGKSGRRPNIKRKELAPKPSPDEAKV